MTEVLDKLASVWIYWMFISFGLGLVGFGFLYYSKYGKYIDKKKARRTGLILIGQIVLTWIIGFGSNWLVQNQARKEVLRFLNQENLVVIVNGSPVGIHDSERIVSELRTIKNITGHHSHPTYEKEIRIESNDDQVKLRVLQDSEYENEYWVFWDKYNVTKSSELGRISID